MLSTSFDFAKMQVTQQSIENYFERGRLYEEGHFSYNDVGVPSKTFTYWKSRGLMDFLGKGKWGRLSFMQLTWVKFLETLRQLNVPVLTMQQLYEGLFTDAVKNKLVYQKLDQKTNELKLKIMSGTASNDESYVYQSLEASLKNKEWMDILNSESSYFFEFIAHCIYTNEQVDCLLHRDGTAHFYMVKQELENSESTYHHKKLEPHLYININQMLSEMIPDRLQAEFIKTDDKIDKREQEVLKQLRNKNVKTVTIHFNDRTREIERVEFDEQGLIQGDKAEQVMRILGLDNFSTIEINTRDKKTLSFKRKQKRYI